MDIAAYDALNSVYAEDTRELERMDGILARLADKVRAAEIARENIVSRMEVNAAELDRLAGL